MFAGRPENIVQTLLFNSLVLSRSIMSARYKLAKLCFGTGKNYLLVPYEARYTPGAGAWTLGTIVPTGRSLTGLPCSSCCTEFVVR